MWITELYALCWSQVTSDTCISRSDRSVGLEMDETTLFLFYVLQPTAATKILG